MTTTLSRVAIVVGEASGDTLGVGLMMALKQRFPECHFEGIGGPKMLEQGFESHFPMDRLAVMGLIDPLKRLPELLNIRKSLRQRYLQDPPDIFIGIDAPDFNLSLEKALKQAGVKTAHYVSPSVWAWRQGRVKTIAKAVDLMLTLFPFEAQFYVTHKVPVRFVGHPLADKIPVEDQKLLARETLGLSSNVATLALLPGSRQGEVEKLSHVFLNAARICHERMGALKILIPAANNKRLAQLKAYVESYSDLDIRLSEGDSHEVMAAADVVLMASGTTTLEAMLLKRPMVIAYRMAAFSFWLLKRLVKSKYVGLPNLLAEKLLVPELLQNDATPEKIAGELLAFFESPGKSQNLMSDFHDIHVSLRKNASESAAQAISDLVLGADK